MLGAGRYWLRASEANLPDDWREQVAAAIYAPRAQGAPAPEGGGDRAWGIRVCALLGCVAGSLGGQVPVQLRQANG